MKLPKWAEEFSDIQMEDATEEVNVMFDRVAEERKLIEELKPVRTTHDASQVFFASPRHIIYDWLGVTALRSRYDHDINMESGNYTEDAVFDFYAENNLHLHRMKQMHIKLFTAETGLFYPIHGIIDFPLINPKTGEIIPGEIKSTKDWGEDKGYDLWHYEKPSREHVGQLTLYMKYLGVSYGYVIYYNKNRGLIYPIKVNFSQKLYEAAMEYFAVIERHLLATPMPAIPEVRPKDHENFPHYWESKDPASKKVHHCEYYEYEFGGKPLQFKENPQKVRERLETLIKIRLPKTEN